LRVADKRVFWNRHDEGDRVAFVQYLAPLVTASRTKTFTKAEASVYLLTLQDVPRDALALAVTRLIENGITWMPRPGDIKTVCCAVVDERRALVNVTAQKIQGDCLQCVHSKGWMEVTVNGIAAMDHCDCWRRAKALLDGADEPLARPALPAWDGDPAA
jgi:uncharacterized Zn-binding protein involved in type VI secretion